MRRWLLTLSLVAAALSAQHVARAAATGVDEPPTLVVRFLSVGQGDATWLTTPDGRTVFIDCGPTSNGRRLVADLISAGVTHIDVLAPSHAHADHMGGCTEVIRRLPVYELLWTGQTDSSLTWRTFWTEVQGRGIPVTRLFAGQVFEWGHGATLQVYNPRERPEGSRIDEYDDSHVLVIEFAGTRVLFVGDLHARGEQRLLADEIVPRAHILKVSEHGSAAGSSVAFLEAVRPQVAIISYGLPNAFDLPDPVVLERLQAVGASTLHTPETGSITIRIGGYVVSTDR